MKKTLISFVVLFFTIHATIVAQTSSVEERKHIDRINSFRILAGEMVKPNRKIDLTKMNEWREAFADTSNVKIYWPILIGVLEVTYDSNIKNKSNDMVKFTSAYIDESSKKVRIYKLDTKKLLLIRKKKFKK